MYKIIAGLFCILLLSSCNAASMTGAENLLVAPKMNARQAQVSQALESSLSLSEIIYKYPQHGDYRSPFVFFDLHGNGREEAIVFYSSLDDKDGIVRAKVLTQNPEGEWFPFYDITLQSGEIEFVEFHKLLSASSYCMLVGIQGTLRGPSMLSVYSMRGDAFILEAEHQFYNYSVRDFNGDGLADIAVIARSLLDHTFYLTVLQKQGSHLAPGPRIGLSPEVETVKMLTYGKLWDGGGALYIDELLADGPVPTTATEIIRVDAAGLTLLAGGEPSRGGAYSPARINYEATFRDEAIYCMDIDGSGTVEVPYPASLPGIYGNDAVEIPKLVQLMQLREDGFRIQRSAVINTDAGYLLFFPERWQDGAVTVEHRTELSDWIFRKWDAEAQEPAEMLLLISTAPARDAGKDSGHDIELAVKGMTSYLAYIPRLQNEALAVTEQEVRELFRLLPY